MAVMCPSLSLFVQRTDTCTEGDSFALVQMIWRQI